jgi:hypothetical protein
MARIVWLMSERPCASDATVAKEVVKNMFTRRVALALATVLCLGAPMLAQPTDRFDGTLMPVKCKNDNPETHARDCALECAATGLGLLTEAGEYLKFSAEGDKKGLEWLTATTRESNLKVRVTGSVKDGLLHVVSITER